MTPASDQPVLNDSTSTYSGNHEIHRPPKRNLANTWLLLTGVAVEKLFPPKSAKIKSRQDALQTTFSVLVDIFYPPNSGCFEKKGLFQQSQAIALMRGSERKRGFSSTTCMWWMRPPFFFCDFGEWGSGMLMSGSEPWFFGPERVGVRGKWKESAGFRDSWAGLWNCLLVWFARYEIRSCGGIFLGSGGEHGGGGTGMVISGGGRDAF